MPLLAGVAGARGLRVRIVSRLVIESLQPVTDLIFPPRCPACGEIVGRQGGLCQTCWSTITPPADLPPGLVAATRYDALSRKLVLAFKHGGQIALAPLLARMIAGRLPDEDGKPALLVPVPLHRFRLWQRGYNQSALLVQALARAGRGVAAVDGLERVRHTPSLGKLSASARHAALRDAIRVNRRHLLTVRGRNVIVVDDVHTTGATAAACRLALQREGAANVTVACFAAVEVGRSREKNGAQTTTPETIAVPGVR